MARFLIEVPHEGTKKDCIRAVEVFLRTGSHYLTHADWGCKDGDHKSWMTVEVGSKEEARNIVPPDYRPVAKIVQLNGFSVQDLENMLGTHGK
jgi:hypothetical protein